MPETREKIKERTVFRQIDQYIIVNAQNQPMNNWNIFPHPAGSVRTFPSEDIAEKELNHLKTVSKLYRSCLVMKACLSWSNETGVDERTPKELL